MVIHKNQNAREKKTNEKTRKYATRRSAIIRVKSLLTRNSNEDDAANKKSKKKKSAEYRVYLFTVFYPLNSVRGRKVVSTEVTRIFRANRYLINMTTVKTSMRNKYKVFTFCVKQFF